MPDESDGLKAYYAVRAREYDRVYAKPERQADLRAIEHWLAGALRDRAILEVACGTGYWTQHLAPVARQLLAVDASRETLDIARSRVPESNTRFVVGDAYRLPTREAGFDGAFAGFWFSHVPRARVAEFLGGLHRALVPGAKVVLLDNRFVDGSSTAIAERDAAGDTWQRRTLDDGSTHRVLKNFPSRDDLAAAVRGAAGVIRYHAWPYFWALEYDLSRP